jgi:hypothetical protein
MGTSSSSTSASSLSSTSGSSKRKRSTPKKKDNSPSKASRTVKRAALTNNNTDISKPAPPSSSSSSSLSTGPVARAAASKSPTKPSVNATSSLTVIAQLREDVAKNIADKEKLRRELTDANNTIARLQRELTAAKASSPSTNTSSSSTSSSSSLMDRDIEERYIAMEQQLHQMRQRSKETISHLIRSVTRSEVDERDNELVLQTKLIGKLVVSSGNSHGDHEQLLWRDGKKMEEVRNKLQQIDIEEKQAKTEKDELARQRRNQLAAENRRSKKAAAAANGGDATSGDEGKESSGGRSGASSSIEAALNKMDLDSKSERLKLDKISLQKELEVLEQKKQLVIRQQKLIRDEEVNYPHASSMTNVMCYFVTIELIIK